MSYVFLKRKPRIFLVGNPTMLGFSEAQRDKYGVSWFEAVIAVSNMIFANEDIPEGLEPHWFNNTLYFIESPYKGVLFSVQGYEEFNELLTKAKKTGNPSKLFKYSPPIKKYAIPPDGEKREMFSIYIKALSDVTKYYQEKLSKITQGIDNLSKLAKS